MSVIGHTRERIILERELPPVTLLSGPESVGKQTLSRHLADHHQVPTFDRFTTDGPLTVDAVRSIRTFSHRSPFGTFKLISVDLDKASSASLNALLKTLEEPPRTARFLLTASLGTFPTIISRSTVFRLGLLTDDEVTEVLLAQGLSRPRAQRAAKLSRGQIHRALKADQTGDESRATVTAVMKAISLSDRDAFHRAFRTWDDYTTEMLSTWFTEAITGRWALFTEEDTFGLRHDRSRLMEMITAVGRVHNARARLGARAALEPFTQR